MIRRTYYPEELPREGYATQERALVDDIDTGPYWHGARNGLRIKPYRYHGKPETVAHYDRLYHQAIAQERYQGTLERLTNG